MTAFLRLFVRGWSSFSFGARVVPPNIAHFRRPFARLVRKCCPAVLLAFAFGMFAAAQWLVAAPPELRFMAPPGGQRGTTVSVDCHGQFDWPVQVWSSGLNVRARKEKGKLQIEIPKEFIADRAWIRLFNDDGVSQRVPFLIGSVPAISEAEPNDTATTAQRLDKGQVQNGVTVDGHLAKNGEVDCFAVDLKQGETIVASIAANAAFGSPMDAILQIVSPRGTVVAENHDAVGLDPRVVFDIPRDGTYIVRLFAFAATPNTRIAFHGGDDYRYRLTVTTGPFITHTRPLCAAKDGDLLQPVGWNFPDDATCHVRSSIVDGEATELEIEDADQRVAFDAQLGFVASSLFAGSARVRMLPFCEPAHEAVSTKIEAGSVLSLPVCVTQKIAQPNTTQTVLLSVSKGEPVIVAVEAVSLALPLVPLVRIQGPDGSVVSEFLESGPARDAILSFTAKQTGNYRVMIGDRYRRGGERFYYRLTARKAVSSFRIVAEQESITVSPDKPAELSLTVERFVGHDGPVGPVKISPVDLPEGIRCKPVISDAEGETSKKVQLVIESDGRVYSGPIRFLGTATKPHPIQRSVVTPAKYGGRLPHIWLTSITSKKTAE